MLKEKLLEVLKQNKEHLNIPDGYLTIKNNT